MNSEQEHEMLEALVVMKNLVKRAAEMTEKYQDKKVIQDAAKRIDALMNKHSVVSSLKAAAEMGYILGYVQGLRDCGE